MSRADDELELAWAWAWANGDVEAGRSLVDLYQKDMWRFFFNKNLSAPTIEELVQETFYACAQSIKDFKGNSTFRKYIYSIARNLFYKYLKKRNKNFDPLTDSVEELISSKTEQPSALDRVLHQEEKDRVHAALRRLPINEQILLELAYWERLSNRELAEITGVPLGTLKSRLRKARLNFQKILNNSDGSALDP